MGGCKVIGHEDSIVPELGSLWVKTNGITTKGLLSLGVVIGYQFDSNGCVDWVDVVYVSDDRCRTDSWFPGVFGGHQRWFCVWRKP